MRGANDAVVVFAADIAFVLDGGVVESLGHTLDEEWGIGLGEIKKRIEMEVTIATMAMDSRLHVELFEESFDFEEELAEVLGWDSHIFEESSGTLLRIKEL